MIARLLTPFFALALLAAAWSPTTQAADFPPVFRALEGEWRAEGEAFGASAKSSMIWAPTLDGEFYRIVYRIEMARATGIEIFEGVGYYQALSAESARGFWVDNSGDLHPLTVKIEPSALTSHWGTAGGKQGRTVYRLTAGDSVEVTDWILAEEGWRRFNRAVFRRAGAD
ncbi:hypothetical protein [Amphiplicatus metriothermophilus]|uniref:DUF1579 domain-containing protein n=1 Tax=Amphiplicatus metriothermophilus TaxID=1519374 RepID=A0A239PPN7_9PROT|nr:hypothetical protein [Amphiplicatus metriothermophilus]MBB5518572.1 hypothetical protein [Amphiplicatus metriothermophilus]SNT72269.1 hypothetical protein SAMN06297382_1307 [Amphiplicatus metriothermophilus]